MNNPTTLEEALKLVPEYIVLTEESQLKAGDEFWSCEGSRWQQWDESYILAGEHPMRRPIPQEVRERMAWWVIYRSLATVPPNGFPYVYTLMIRGTKQWIEVKMLEDGIGMPGFATEDLAKEAIPILGGEKTILNMLSYGAGIMESWLLKGGET